MHGRISQNREGSWPVPPGANPNSLAGIHLDPELNDKLFEDFQRDKGPELERRVRPYDTPFNWALLDMWLD